MSAPVSPLGGENLSDDNEKLNQLLNGMKRAVLGGTLLLFAILWVSCGRSGFDLVEDKISIRILSPDPNTFINRKNASAFALTGACGPLVDEVVVSASGTPGGRAPCVEGGWNLVLDLSDRQRFPDSASFVVRAEGAAYVRGNDQQPYQKDTVFDQPAENLGWGGSGSVSTRLSNSPTWSPSPATDLASQTLELYRGPDCNILETVMPSLSSTVSLQRIHGAFGERYSYLVRSQDHAGNENQSSCASPLTLFYDATGVLDESFAPGTPPGARRGSFILDSAAGGQGNDYGEKLRLTDDGHIVVVGANEGANGDRDMVVWQLTPNGQLDPTFGDSDRFGQQKGFMVHNSAAGGDGMDYALDVRVLSSGHIVVAGFSFNGTDEEMVVWKLTPDGRLDPSFGDDNSSGQRKGFMVHGGAAGGTNDRAQGLAVDASGRILVAGYSTTATGDHDAVVWRLTPDGRLDTGYGDPDGSGGQKGFAVLGATGGEDEIRSVSVDASGRAVASGHGFVPGRDREMVVWRLTADGRLDPSFGDPDGRGQRSGSIVHSSAAGGNGIDQSRGHMIDQEGRIVVTGHSENAAANPDMVLWRLNEDGTLDRDFGDDDGGGQKKGFTVQSDVRGFAGRDRGIEVIVDALGRILVTGTTRNPDDQDAIIWRFTPNGHLDTSFGAPVGAARTGFVVLEGAAGGSGLDYVIGIELDRAGQVFTAGASTNTDRNLDLFVARWQ